MDVEKAIRINALAKELQKHGIALTSEDAFIQAEDIVKQKTETEPAAKKEQHPKEQAAAEPLHSLHLEKADDTALLEKRYQMMLEMSSKRMEEQFGSLKSRIGALESEIEQLKFELKKIPAQIAAAQPAKKESQQRLKDEKQEEKHPRQGNFTSEDVAVDKIFYFGNK